MQSPTPRPPRLYTPRFHGRAKCAVPSPRAISAPSPARALPCRPRGASRNPLAGFFALSWCFPLREASWKAGGGAGGAEQPPGPRSTSPGARSRPPEGLWRRVLPFQKSLWVPEGEFRARAAGAGGGLAGRPRSAPAGAGPGRGEGASPSVVNSPIIGLVTRGDEISGIGFREGARRSPRFPAAPALA